MTDDSKNKSRISGWLLRIIGLVLFVYVLFSVDLGAAFSILAAARPLPLVAVALLLFVIAFAKAGRWKYLLGGQGVEISFGRALYAMTIEFMAFFLVSSLGSLTKLAYLDKKINSLPLGLTALVVEKAFDLLIPVALGITGIILIKCGAESYFNLLFPSAVAVSLIILLSGRLTNLVARHAELLQKIGAKIKLLKMPENFFHELPRRLNSKYLWGGSISTAGILLVYFVSFLLLARAIAIDITFLQAIIIDTVVTLIVLMPISFMGFGTREVSLIYMLSLYGFGREAAFAMSMMMVVIRIVTAIPGMLLLAIKPRA